MNESKRRTHRGVLLAVGGLAVALFACTLNGRAVFQKQPRSKPPQEVSIPRQGAGQGLGRQSARSVEITQATFEGPHDGYWLWLSWTAFPVVEYKISVPRWGAMKRLVISIDVQQVIALDVNTSEVAGALNDVALTFNSGASFLQVEVVERT